MDASLLSDKLDEQEHSVAKFFDEQHPPITADNSKLSSLQHDKKADLRET